MIVIKFIFVLLILIPVAIVIIYIINNLTDETLKESERAAKAAAEARKPKYDRYGNKVYPSADRPNNLSAAEKRSTRKERKKRRNNTNREGAEV